MLLMLFVFSSSFLAFLVEQAKSYTCSHKASHSPLIRLIVLFVLASGGRPRGLNEHFHLVVSYAHWIMNDFLIKFLSKPNEGLCDDLTTFDGTQEAMEKAKRNCKL